MKPVEFIDFLRAFIRPYIIITGWTTGLILGVFFALEFADREIAMAFILILTGAITTISAMYVGERAGKKKEEK